MGLIRAIGNILWFFLSGLWLAIAYAVVGVIMCVLIITIPFGIASFRMAGFVLWPFGRTIVRRGDAGVGSFIGNVLWFVIAGLWIAVVHILTGLVLCLTIIGIPFGVANFKLAGVAIAPLGKEIVPCDQRAQFVS